MKLIVGLGNPGIRYAWTRHNIGRHLVEALAEKERLKWVRKAKLKASIALTRWGDQEVQLARPDVFRNLSGEPVALLVREASIDISRDLLIVVDDTALPFGKLRLRGKGTDGGHNGLKSIHQSLGTTDYPRLRMGVAPGNSGEKITDMAGYVLESFDSQEKKVLQAVFEKGFEACRLWALESLAAAMNTVNPDKT